MAFSPAQIGPVPPPRCTAHAARVLLVALLALGPTACDAGQAPHVSQAGARDAPFPRRIEVGDETLVLAAAPRRIVPASAAAVDLVCALVAPERIAGMPVQARDYSGLRDPDSPYLGRPQFAVYAAEPVLALAPDLVVTDRWQLAETSARLRAAGVAVLPLPNLERLDDVRAALRLLARALGAEAEAETLMASLDARLLALARRPGSHRGLRALAYSNGGTGGWVAGAGTSADEWIAAAGLQNAAAEAGREGHVRCDYEELLALDPDLIVVSGRGDWDDFGATGALLRGEPALAELAAVRNGRIVQLDAWLYSTVGPQVVTAAEALVDAIERLPASSR